MWCHNCQADVAAEVSPDNRRIRCASCGSELSTTHFATPPETTREARELLERWSAGNILDPPPPPPPKPHFRVDPPHSPQETYRGHAPGPQSNREPLTPPGGVPGGGYPPPQPPTHRVNVPPPAQSAPPPAPPAPPATTHPGGYYPSPQSRQRYDAPHPVLSGPHFDVQTLIAQNQEKRTNWVALIGQLLAYGGVVMLTIGTAVLLSGYFGGPDQYTPTGWLLATVGQMLLFLGVVTLVSCGMEQTTDEVSKRVDTLGVHILRMEQATQAMRETIQRHTPPPPPPGQRADAA